MTEKASPGIYYLDLAAAVGESDFTPGQRACLQAVKDKVADAPSLDEVMNFLWESTRECIPCERLGLAFISEDGLRLVSNWNKTTYENAYLRQGYGEDLSGSSLEQVITTGRLRVINDLEGYGREHPASISTKLILREGIRSSLTCPLVVQGRRIGVMFRSSREANRYDAPLARLHLAMAGRISQAVEKAWMIERLTEANRSYTEMLGFVSHELKSPLASLLMDAQLFTDGYLGELSDKQRDKIVRMSDKARYLMGLVGEYLDLARLESQDLRINPRPDVHLQTDVIDPAVSIVQAQLDAKHMRLQTDLSPADLRAQLDPDTIKIVLVNLLSNAIKYGNERSAIDLQASRAAGRLQVSVRNEGPGFTHEQKSQLFKKFSRLQSPELLKQKGTGVGLYTCHRLIALHHGRITADSHPGQWAKFTFSIPQPLPD